MSSIVGNLDRPQFAHSSPSLRKPYVLSTPEIVPSICVPAPINQYLREYQRDGIKFLYDQYMKGVGGLLCDDMGLGKTVQVIAFICAILCKTCTMTDVLLTGPKLAVSKSAILVLCPCSVIYNWVSEIETWSHLKTGVYHRNKKDEILDKVSRGRLDVVLTTLETAKLKMEELNSIPWLAVFVDEVHALKNPKSQVTDALLQLKCRIRFGLTGTALQNRLSELWCILNWIHPGCLGAWHEFQFIYERPLLQGQKFDSTRRELATAKEKQQKLGQLLSNWMIRRTKELIADQLPKKEEFVVFCPFTKLQGNIYSAILETDEMVNFVEAHQPCWCNSGLSKLKCCEKHCSSGMLSVQGIYLSLLLKCSNHIGLLLPSFIASDKQNEKAYQICKHVFSHYPEFLEMSTDASFLTLADPTYCGKMQLLIQYFETLLKRSKNAFFHPRRQILSKLLNHFHLESSKVIIFSESVRLLNILENYMVCRSYTYCRLDGSMKIEDRGAIVSKFNSDPSLFVFLISKKCGGVGLNITGANRVIIFDPSWNPANDLQAEDRAFRIGQRHNVEVYRLISEGTIEEILYLRQVYKQQLANTAIEGSNERRYFTGVDGDSDNKGEIFGVLNLFQPLRCGTSLTENVLKRFDQGLKMSSTQFTDRDFLQGVRVLIHHGQIVGNSPAEEHIRHQAICHLDNNSQLPANILNVQEEIKEIECHDESAKKAPEKSELSQYFQEFDDKGCQPSNCSAIMDEPALTREPKKIKINELFDFDEAMEFSGQSESFHSKLMLNTTEKSILSIDNLFDL